jgi:hypothetical protein
MCSGHLYVPSGDDDVERLSQAIAPSVAQRDLTVYGAIMRLDAVENAVVRHIGPAAVDAAGVRSDDRAP